MQLSDLLPAVGELIPYDYETIRTPEYETLLAGVPSGRDVFEQGGSRYGIRQDGRCRYCIEYGS